MKFIALVLSFALLVQFNLLILPTYADTVTVTTTTTSTPGGLTGQVPVTKVGALIAGDALAILSGTEIKIESKSKSKSNSSSSSTPPSNLLTGVLMQTKSAGSGASGYAVFNGGDRFGRISNTNCPDKITTTTGATYTGSITSATAAAISISTSSGSQTVSSSDIADIHSARAFKYDIPDVAAPKMNFTTTCIHSVAAASKSTDHGNTAKKLIIVGLALTVVAVAIAVPVGIAAGGHHHNNNNQNNIIAANLLAARSRSTVPQPTLPASMTMPTPQQLGNIYISNLQRLKSSSSVSSSVSSSSSSGGQFVTTQGGTFFSP